MARHIFVDTTRDYQKRQGMRIVGWTIIGIMLLFGLAMLLDGKIKAGLILIITGIVLG